MLNHHIASVELLRHLHFTFGLFELRPDGTLLRNSVVITLPPKELLVLRCLLAKAGQVVSLEELRREAWGNVHVSRDSLPRCISSLRARLDSHQCIATVYKRGYRFDLSVQKKSEIGGPNTPGFSGPLASARRTAGIELVPWRRHDHPRLIFVPFRAGPEVPSTLGEQITEASMMRLSRGRPLEVDILAYDSVTALTCRGLTALEVGTNLGADFAMTGCITALPVHFRLRAEMFRVADAVQVWVEDFVIPRSLVSVAETHLARVVSMRIRNTFAAFSVLDFAIPGETANGRHNQADSSVA